MLILVLLPTIMTFVRPLVADLGLTPFLIISIVILGIITQVTHNIVLGAMFIPFLLPVFAEMGGNIYLLWFALYFVLNTAYCTPAASFQAALVFGHEATERKHAYILGIVLLVVCWISLVVVGIPLGNLIF